MDVAQDLLLHGIHLLGAVGLVAPVSRQSPLRHLMHLTGAYLHLDPLSRRTHHGDMERPVAIGLRVSQPVTRTVILEGKVGCEYVVDPEAVGILRAIRLRLKDDYETMMYKFANQDMLIFTRKGDRIRCPQDFTVLDFAYQLDPELGRRCIGAKVNHEMVDISAKLQNGDQVEILTTENTEPKESWLQYATSPTTKRYITDFLHRQEADQIEAGRKAFVRFAEGRGYDPEHVLPEDEQAPVLSYPSRDQFFLAVNRYEVRMDHALMKHLIKARKEARTRTQEPTVQQREDVGLPAPTLHPLVGVTCQTKGLLDRLRMLTMIGDGSRKHLDHCGAAP